MERRVYISSDWAISTDQQVSRMNMEKKRLFLM
jgi:hypothetical protein